MWGTGGRLKANAPVAGDDVARKTEVDAEATARADADAAHAALTDAHGSTVTPTANAIVRWASGGRLRAEAPIYEIDVTNKAYVDAEATARAGADADHAALTNPHGATTTPTASRIAMWGTGGRLKASAPSAGDDVARKTEVDAVIPSGTLMLFVQTAAPTGWTKVTTHNNKALRVVSGTAGSGGSVGFTTAFHAARTVSVGNTTLTVDQMPAHPHGGVMRQGTTTSENGRAVANGLTVTVNVDTDSAGGGQSHGHSASVALDVLYVDVIIARKD
ncbi:MAG: hypothetical protein CVU57_19135 [Deltaproteobacteria bacterium HGW-Deltaproteobacteria-15]|nr:MAG: hypothetical protein CVU57_19135 [Deltaproteobacteria bacterium HGW-Deltaproteobacteria-15]